MEILIKEIVGSVNPISHSNGIILYNHLKSLGSKDFSISFEGLVNTSTGFLNASLGKLIVEGVLSLDNINRDTEKGLVKTKMNNIVRNIENKRRYEKVMSDFQIG